VEVSPNSFGQFPIKEGLLIGIKKRAFGLPLGDKIHFLNGFSVRGGPALIDIAVDRKNACSMVKPLGRPVPTRIGGPRKLDPAIQIFLG
jgi:hypothetical protein